MEKVTEKVEDARVYFGIKDYPGNLFEYITNQENYINKFNMLLFKMYIGNTSGFISYSKSSDTPFICINYKRCIGHQNFTLAHELGHLFLHKGIVISDTNDHIIGRDSDIIEAEANQFASELIYPEKNAKEDLEYINRLKLFRAKNSEKLGNYINELCKKYTISFSFALSKLLYLDKWEWGVNKKIWSVKNKIGPLNKKYESYLHVFTPDHRYYKPYNDRTKLMEMYVNELIELEEISYETGHAILNRNKVLEG